jgi:catechol 2,3-dioxygenase-like lactoylglutathione lyase family enzyme
MLGEIYHTGYLTDDLERAIDFCKRTYGGDVVKRMTNPDGSLIAYWQCGGTEFELIEPRDKSSLNGRTGLIIDHIGVFVDDIDRWIVELKAKGQRFLTPEPYVSGLGFRVIYIDPATNMGTRVHLTEARR